MKDAHIYLLNPGTFFRTSLAKLRVVYFNAVIKIDFVFLGGEGLEGFSFVAVQFGDGFLKFFNFFQGLCFFCLGG